ncbi:hypothetical protein KR044_002292, partial [Drosophila immigrans]
DAAVVKFTNIVCHSTNSTIYIINTCRLKALQRNKIVLYYNATAHYKITHLSLHFQIVKKANGYKPWLYNYYMDCCDYLKRRNNPVLNMVTNIIKESSNFIHPCPFEGPELITGLYLKPNSIPLPLPTGEYGVENTFTLNNVTVVKLNVYFELIEDV